MSLLFNGINCKKIHFIGIFGSGMSAIAQYLRFQKIDVSGSDRSLFNESTSKIRESLQTLGCTLFEQNGSGIDNTTDIVCVSTAIETDNPDIIASDKHAIPIVHRSDLLASILKTKKTIAIAGTSGKSTVTAMIFEFLTFCGHSPSLISGAPLRRLEHEGYIGNAFSGNSDLLIIEADESDGSLVKYEPHISVFLNLSKDHKSIPEVIDLFKKLASHSTYTFKNIDDPNLEELSSTFTFGLHSKGDWFPDSVKLHPMQVKLTQKNNTFILPNPGLHNASNCAAALSICTFLQCNTERLATAVSEFEGVSRRFTVYKTLKRILIVDDFAHNPEKIKAAVTAAQGLSHKVIAIYQPHGFGPTRFLKDDYCSAFKTIFSKQDVLFLLPIFYAGGTAQKDISSNDLIHEMGTISFYAEAASDRNEVISYIKEHAKEGDCILVMGARDPSLPQFVQTIVELFGGTL